MNTTTSNCCEFHSNKNNSKTAMINAILLPYVSAFRSMPPYVIALDIPADAEVKDHEYSLLCDVFPQLEDDVEIRNVRQALLKVMQDGQIDDLIALDVGTELYPLSAMRPYYVNTLYNVRVYERAGTVHLKCTGFDELKDLSIEALDTAMSDVLHKNKTDTCGDNSNAYIQLGHGRYT